MVVLISNVFLFQFIVYFDKISHIEINFYKMKFDLLVFHILFSELLLKLYSCRRYNYIVIYYLLASPLVLVFLTCNLSLLD